MTPPVANENNGDPSLGKQPRGRWTLRVIPFRSEHAIDPAGSAVVPIWRATALPPRLRYYPRFG